MPGPPSDPDEAGPATKLICCSDKERAGHQNEEAVSGVSGDACSVTELVSTHPTWAGCCWGGCQPPAPWIRLPSALFLPGLSTGLAFQKLPVTKVSHKGKGFTSPSCEGWPLCPPVSTPPQPAAGPPSSGALAWLMQGLGLAPGAKRPGCSHETSAGDQAAVSETRRRQCPTFPTMCFGGQRHLPTRPFALVTAELISPWGIPSCPC